ncbi:MAG: hypothetical protein ABN473_17585, partial [Nocardioides kribbensis]
PISRSSVVATEHRMRQGGRGPGGGQAGPGGQGGPGGPKPGDAPAPDAPVRAADRVPHGLRAMVPAPVRRGLRKAAGRER